MTAAALRRLALVVIARDEASRIARLLDSVRPWVDEMLVLDTGSIDGTPAVARAHGARVSAFTWCDDFSVARNQALALAGADWHLVLDADEWLIGGGEALQALRETPPGFVGALQLRDRFDGGAGQQGEAVDWLSRVLPGPLRYAGRVHEQPVHTLPVRRLPLVVGHDGYVSERLADKRGRNRRLLHKALAEAPGDAYLHYQLGKDCAVYDEHEAAEAAFAQACALPGVAAAPWWMDLVVRRLFELKCLGRHADAMDFAQSQMAAGDESPDFFFAIGDLLLDLAASQPEQAGELLPMIEAAWQRCLVLGERPEQVGAVVGRGSYLAAHNLAVVLEGTGRSAEASALRAAHPRPC
ncbi:glycosyltransferase family 2 protein [Roseateles cellulosilyticus]|uniref:Glycosyltransferase family 2 protein n=1 Tax=Pelomonas cellulosilytica TaxID=2906762 RepID=A0ABS8XSY0_9BURK|nr:glycosyltransferase family 2 protein [Pelomonas sp. P8]MCE4554840.1 glycosyltransferase family 2 protein [Pelomonas sp. P8]